MKQIIVCAIKDIGSWIKYYMDMFSLIFWEQRSQTNKIRKHRGSIEAILKIWGEGFPGTTLKDSWTKPWGRVEAGKGGRFGWGEVEGWGENADNCNWTTIK